MHLGAIGVCVREGEAGFPSHAASSQQGELKGGQGQEGKWLHLTFKMQTEAVCSVYSAIQNQQTSNKQVNRSGGQ